MTEAVATTITTKKVAVPYSDTWHICFDQTYTYSNWITKCVYSIYMDVLYNNNETKPCVHTVSSFFLGQLTALPLWKTNVYLLWYSRTSCGLVHATASLTAKSVLWCLCVGLRHSCRVEVGKRARRDAGRPGEDKQVKKRACPVPVSFGHPVFGPTLWTPGTIAALIRFPPLPARTLSSASPASTRFFHVSQGQR